MHDTNDRRGEQTPEVPPGAVPRLPLARSAYRELDDAALIDLMRRGDERAIEEFLIRNQRLLYDRVRRWRIALHEVEDCISDVLEDLAVLIVNGKIRPTRSVAAYAVKALRARLALRAKSETQRHEVEYGAAEHASGVGERAIASAVSENTMRATQGVEWEPLPVPRAVRRLASMIDEGLSDEERRILTWLSNYVPQRDICEWLGVTYAAGTQRIWRLRERLRTLAEGHAARFDVTEQLELELFFRRMRDPKHRDEPRSRGGTP